MGASAIRLERSPARLVRVRAADQTSTRRCLAREGASSKTRVRRWERRTKRSLLVASRATTKRARRLHGRTRARWSSRGTWSSSPTPRRATLHLPHLADDAQLGAGPCPASYMFSWPAIRFRASSSTMGTRSRPGRQHVPCSALPSGTYWNVVPSTRKQSRTPHRSPPSWSWPSTRRVNHRSDGRSVFDRSSLGSVPGATNEVEVNSSVDFALGLLLAAGDIDLSRRLSSSATTRTAGACARSTQPGMPASGTGASTS
jgi:hypothetical protein